MPFEAARSTLSAAEICRGQRRPGRQKEERLITDGSREPEPGTLEHDVVEHAFCGLVVSAHMVTTGVLTRILGRWPSSRLNKAKR